MRPGPETSSPQGVMRLCQRPSLSHLTPSPNGSERNALVAQVKRRWNRYVAALTTYAITHVSRLRNAQPFKPKQHSRQFWRARRNRNQTILITGVTISAFMTSQYIDTLASNLKRQIRIIRYSTHRSSFPRVLPIRYLFTSDLTSNEDK